MEKDAGDNRAGVTHTGGCSCGQVRFEATGAPVRVGICHCFTCRKFSGAPFSTFVIYPRAAVTIHGRTREQGFGGKVNHAGIRAVVEAVERIPVIGNGDVRSVADAARLIEETGCHGIAIGRGALANPWFFKQLAAWIETGDPGSRGSYHDRLAFMRRHLVRLIEWRKSEKLGCSQFRKVASWYTKALKMPKSVQHQFNLLISMEQFDSLIKPFAESGPPPGWTEWDATSAEISVPTGPNAHW